MLLGDEDAQRTRAWRLWHVSEEAREAEQHHWKASVWKRLRMEQKVKEMVSGENKHQGTMFLCQSSCVHARDGQRVNLEFSEADRVGSQERERCRHCELSVGQEDTEVDGCSGR